MGVRRFCPKCETDTERYKDGRCKPCANAYSRKWYRENVESTKERCRKWREANPERVKLMRKLWMERNPEKRKARNKKCKEIHLRWQKGWRQWFRLQDLHICKRCGYDKCFAAIDFHHIDSKSKRFNIATAIKRKPTEEAKKFISEEIKKCIPLCANCHREIAEEKKGGGCKHDGEREN